METTDELIVSTGIGGDGWATYRRAKNGSLHRVKSPRLPVRATKREAQEDLYDWLHQQLNQKGRAIVPLVPMLERAQTRLAREMWAERG